MARAPWRVEGRLSDILLVALFLVVLPACFVGIVKLIEFPPAAVTRLIHPGRDDARQACSYYSQEARPGGSSDLDLLTLAEEEANQAADKSDRYRPLLRAWPW